MQGYGRPESVILPLEELWPMYLFEIIKILGRILTTKLKPLTYLEILFN